MVFIAQIGLIVTLSILLIFHFLIVLKIIPYTMVWGGRIKTEKEMYRFEVVSILINLFFLFVIVMHLNILPISFPKIIMKSILWVMSFLFAINTLGNILSKNKFEQRLFTTITILLTIFSLILASTS